MDIKEFYRKARISAEQSKFGQLSEDIAQEAVIMFLKKNKPGQTVDQTVIDAARKLLGRYRGAKYDGIRKALHRAGALTLLSKKPALSSEELVNGQIDFEKYLNLFSGSDRALLALRFLWGMTTAEIGYCFGVDESRISQKMKTMFEVIEKHAIGEKQRKQSKTRFRKLKA